VTDSHPVAELLLRVAAQDRTVFRDLYAATSSKLVGVLVRMLRDRAKAEDAVQRVFTTVWHRAGRYATATGRGTTWLIAIARNLAFDRRRRLTEDLLAQGQDL
jgi:RNA polymerase sigma-70 factor (ECF subfamily)